jgi:hypothetical protein
MLQSGSEVKLSQPKTLGCAIEGAVILTFENQNRLVFKDRDCNPETKHKLRFLLFACNADLVFSCLKSPSKMEKKFRNRSSWVSKNP